MIWSFLTRHHDKAVNGIKPRILIVEDDQDFAIALQGELADSFRVSLASDVTAALHHLRDSRPDAVLLDVILQRESGLRFLTAIRGTSEETIPILLMTGAAADMDLSPFAGLVQGVIAKPFSPDEVAERLSALLTPTASAREVSQPPRSRSILIVEDDADLRTALVDQLNEDGYRAVGFGSPEKALDQMRHGRYDVLLTDWILPQINGLDLLRQVKKRSPHTIGILLTGYGTPDFIARALAMGATDVLVKPVPLETLSLTIEKCIQVAQRATSQAMPNQPTQAPSKPRRTTRYSLESITGQSPAIERARQMLEQIAPLDSTVLILGETGTGKELFAQALHGCSRRASHPFVPINLAAIPETLMESELFGYAPGSFTGANRRGQNGKIVEADGGTFFLDEIGDLPLPLQGKLLRVIQEGEVAPVGGAPRKVNVRFVAATHRNLQAMVQQGSFRSDLYYRINVITLTLPTLRDRPEDIPGLTGLFLEELHQRYGGPTPRLTPEALTRLTRYHWPGNIRELRNVIEYAFAMCTGPWIEADGLPPYLTQQRLSIHARNDSPQSADGVDKDALVRALAQTRGNKARAAKLLGISRTTLYLKLKVFDLME